MIGWAPLLSCICFPTAIPGSPSRSFGSIVEGGVPAKLSVFMVPAASLTSSEVSSSFVWDFLGAHGNFFKVVKG